MTREEFEKTMKNKTVKIDDKPIDYSKYAPKKTDKGEKKGKK